MKISLAQINSTLGDFNSNYKRILDAIAVAKAEDSDLVIFPECCLFGYYPSDLLERQSTVKEQLKYLKLITKNIPKDIFALIGFIDLNKKNQGKPFFNSAALISKNKIHKVFHKELLPTYDIFDEARYFEPGETRKNTFSLKGKKFLVTICEDIWAWPKGKKTLYSQNSIKKIKGKFDAVLNLSASPFTNTKMKSRAHVIERTCLHLKAPMIYVNQVGAQDETIFDGRSLVTNKTGHILQQLNAFSEEIQTIDLIELSKNKKVIPAKRATIKDALTLGIKDFFHKTGFKKAHLGLSGGIDSAVVYALACEALGAENVTALYMPTKFNANLSFKLADQMCKNLGQDLLKFPIEDVFNSFSEHINKNFKINEFGLIHENLQARIRGTILMAFSNQQGSMLLSTGNKTELAVGYTTLYGDMCGGLSPIADLTKTQVYKLAEEINKEQEIIPQQIITRAPSAELRSGQKDQDSLPEYSLLDASVINLVEKSKPANSQLDAWTLNALMKSEFKRWQAPPILKISDHAFGRGRRFPIAHKSKL